MIYGGAKRKLKTTRTFERLASELEEMAANGGSQWKFQDKFNKFGDAQMLYVGSDPIKSYDERVDVAFEAYWSRPENKNAP